MQRAFRLRYKHAGSIDARGSLFVCRPAVSQHQSKPLSSIIGRPCVDDLRAAIHMPDRRAAHCLVESGHDALAKGAFKLSGQVSAAQRSRLLRVAIGGSDHTLGTAAATIRMAGFRE
jgi:hypothetical protein